MCEGKKLEKHLKFKYLDTLFLTDGEHKYGIDRKLNLIEDRWGKISIIIFDTF